MHFTYFSKKRVHLGVTGSVAAYKSIELCRLCQKAGMHVSATLTEAAATFIRPLSFEAIGANPVYFSLFEEGSASVFAHLEPGEFADVLAIVPASATTLSRLAHGLADNLLSAQALAFAGPVVVAPAMNPRMWGNAATQENMSVLRRRGVHVVGPAKGSVACGDRGAGKMEEVEAVFWSICKALAPQDLEGKKVMITLGPTREPWDGVRFWSNPSSGKMGSALAIAAWLRGAEVTAIAGPGVAVLPAGITVISVQTAQAMAAAAQDVWKNMDYGIFAAAVADFSPEPYGTEKFKKAEHPQGFSIQFLPNIDILATLGATQQPHQRVVGFAAETSQVEERTREKLRRKKAHVVAGNQIGIADSGFQSSNNTLFVADNTGREEQWASMSKADAAWRLLTWLSTL